MSINRKIIFCNIGFVAMFLAAYSINRNLMFIATSIPTLFILWNKDSSFGVAEILFLLPFTSMMNISVGTTSLFMLPKLTLILVYFSQKKMKMNKKMFLSLITFLVYFLLINVIKGSFPIIRIINLILWFMIAYCVYQSLKSTLEMTVSCSSYIGGVIVSSMVGMLKNYFPNLSNDLINAQYLNESTGVIVQRFAGLWNDPNGYTVFIICALFSAFWLLNNKKISTFIFAIISATLNILGIMTLSKSCVMLLVLFWVYFLFSSRGMSLQKKVGSMFVLGILCVMGVSMYLSELMELIYRFTGVDGSVNLDALTTYRNSIWNDYIVAICKNDFLFGFGLDAPLVGGFACHNTYLQLWYECGIFGMIVYIIMWKCTVTGIKIEKQSFVPLLFLLVTVFFISCMYIESIYILLPFVLRIGKVSCYAKKNISSVV